MENIRLKLKSEFKNYISDGLKIYYSRNRPVVEILLSLSGEVKENSQIWEEDCRFLISNTEIEKEVLSKLELQEFDFNLMDFKERRIILNYENLFDVCSFDLNEFLDKCSVKEKHIYPFYNDWINVQDCIDITHKLIEEYGWVI